MSDTTTIESRLERLEAEIRAELAAHDLASSGEERGDGHHHPAEAATDAEAREGDLRVQLRAAEQLERIRLAREALAAGRYGLCVDCGAPIPERRLEALPDALRCVPCQSRADRRS
ncbi:MAG: TraR/DksA C4-type zinc finger protein [Actinomycetota bacterium]